MQLVSFNKYLTKQFFLLVLPMRPAMPNGKTQILDMKNLHVAPGVELRIANLFYRYIFSTTILFLGIGKHQFV